MLTPVDIENKEFAKAFRGYDIEEVEEFLRNLVNDYEKLYRENASLKEKNAMQQESIENYRGMEETMQNAIISAQKTAEDIKRNAYTRAENIIREAQTRANESIANADKTIQEMENSYLAMQSEVEAYSARMRSLLETNLKLLDDMPRAELKAIERVQLDPVLIDPVTHTAPLPDVGNAEPDPLAKTIPVPDLKDQAMPSAGSASAEKPEEKAAAEFPVGQEVRSSRINPIVDRLMKEREMQSEKNLKAQSEEEQLAQDAEETIPAEETPAEETVEDDSFAVKKETVETTENNEFSVLGEKEMVFHVDKNAKTDANYYDVFKDDTL